MKNFLLFSIGLLTLLSCEMQIAEEQNVAIESFERNEGHYQITAVSETTLQALGKRLEKKSGYNVIESAQSRQLSDFTFDLSAARLTVDTLKRKTYSIPFLEKGNKYSTFNLVIVTDNTNNAKEQYVLEFKFDSLQHKIFEEKKDMLASGVTLRRFPFSSFFNDSNPAFLQRCEGIVDNNGDPVSCDQIALSYGSGYGGSGAGGNTVWITPGGGGAPAATSGGGSSGSGPTNQGSPCSWSVEKVEVPSCAGDYCQSGNSIDIIVIVCDTPFSRTAASTSQSASTCLACSITDFGAPAFTLTRDATQIDHLLTNYSLSQWHMAYLSTNMIFSTEFKTLLQSEINLNQKAAMITLTAQMEGLIGSHLTQGFGLKIDDLVEADLSNPAILHLFNTYFSARAAFLKLSDPQKYLKNPNGNPKDPNNINKILYYDIFKEAIHWSLDIVGLVPFLGEPSDLLNGVLYVFEGDGVNATISAASAVPFYGIIASGSKIGWKVIGSTSDIQSKRILRWVVNNRGIITFGQRSDLAKNFTNMNTASHQAHHIIPWSTRIQEHPVVQKAADWGFHMNESLNGVVVKKEINQPNHNFYNNFIEQKLNLIKKNFPENKWHEELIRLANKAKEAIEANPNTHLDQLTF